MLPNLCFKLYLSENCNLQTEFKFEVYFISDRSRRYCKCYLVSPE